MKIEGDTITLSNGRQFYANCGIIGLSPSLEISEGYDGVFYSELAPAERKEIADYMIEQWRKFGVHA